MQIEDPRVYKGPNSYIKQYPPPPPHQLQPPKLAVSPHSSQLVDVSRKNVCDTNSIKAAESIEKSRLFS